MNKEQDIFFDVEEESFNEEVEAINTSIDMAFEQLKGNNNEHLNEQYEDQREFIKRNSGRTNAEYNSEQDMGSKESFNDPQPVNSREMGNQSAPSINGINDAKSFGDHPLPNETTRSGDGGINYESSDQRQSVGSQQSRDFRNERDLNGSNRVSDYKSSTVKIIKGQKDKFNKNIEAIKLIKTQELFSKAEQAIIAQYSGWGGLPQVFDESNVDWSDERDSLKSLLSDEEYSSARFSTQDSFYTPKEINDFMWNGLIHMGITSAKNDLDKDEFINILEPSVGIGDLLTYAPSDIDQNFKFTAVELDKVSHQIAKSLHPNQFILNSGFEELSLSQEFDAVISNPPFGSNKIYDENNPDFSGQSIHNYFISKSNHLLKDNGISAFVVSSYFLDGEDSSVRSQIASENTFLGAVRLPNNAFKNSGTSVTTDVIFFKKGIDLKNHQNWVDKSDLNNEHGKFSVNEYFANNPQNILGDFKLVSGAYQESQQCVSDGRDLEKALNDFIVEQLPKNIYVRTQQQEQKEATLYHVPISENENENTHHLFTLKSGDVFTLEGEKGIFRRQDDLIKNGEQLAAYAKLDLNKPNTQRLTDYIKIRDQLDLLFKLEKQADISASILEHERAKLNDYYDQFVKNNGSLLNRAYASKLFKDNDRSWSKVLSLEKNYNKGVSEAVAQSEGIEVIPESAEKADIFYRRVNNPIVAPTVSTPKEALIASLNKTGRVDLPFIQELLPYLEKESIINDLMDDNLIYLDHDGEDYIHSEKYLSGDVVNKLKEASSLAESDPRFSRNVSALRKNQPEKIESVDISVSIGANWIDTKYYEEFFQDLLNTHVEVNYLQSAGKWEIELDQDNISYARKMELSTERVPVKKVLESLLSGNPVKVWDSEVDPDNPEKKIRTLNADETALASTKANEITNRFKDWIWQDKDRREYLESKYNDTFNTYIKPKYDGSHMKFEGMDSSIELRKHQKDAVWRAVQEGNILFDHTVGAGKTKAVIASTMEMKRMGLVNKPLVVVPNHLVPQWKNEWYETYPNANLLVSTPKDLDSDNRELFFAKIATGSYDAIIMTHSQFQKISAPKHELEFQIQKSIDSLRESLSYATEKSYGTKRLESQISNKQQQLKKLIDENSKSKVVDFSDLGVDLLAVDELHLYKNLNIATSMNGIAGLGDLEGSKKAFDLFCKTQWLQKQNGGRGLIGATGTPISNTISEMYTLQRYFDYPSLEKRGVENFDAWAKTFGQIGYNWELDASGVNYKMTSRFSKFQNVPELVGMYHSFSDVVSNKDIQKHVKNFVPELENGKPYNMVAERSDAVAEFIGIDDGNGEYNEGSIIWRMMNFQANPKYNNMLACTTDARKAGLDFRLISPTAEDDPNSKVNMLVDNIYNEYVNTTNVKGTQLAFCDLSTPKKHSQLVSTTDDLSISDEEHEASLNNQQDRAKDNEIKKKNGEEITEVSLDDMIAEQQRFDIYSDVLIKLIDKGIPQNEIRFIHDAKTDLQKEQLFKDVNRGNVRVLIGSTGKMGAGTNVQERVTAIHHLDCPWRPSDLEQRNGRVIRQGNKLHAENPEQFKIKEYRYATKGTYDSRMWQVIESKALAIEQFRIGDSMRVIDDIVSDSANAAEMKALATGNPLILLQVELQAELREQEASLRNHERMQFRRENRIGYLIGGEKRFESEIKDIKGLISNRLPKEKTLKVSTFDNEYSINTESTTDISKAEKKELYQEISKKVILDPSRVNREQFLMKYRGVEIYSERNPIKVKNRTSDQVAVAFSIISSDKKHFSPANLEYNIEIEGNNAQFSVPGLFQRIDNFLDNLEHQIEDIENLYKEEKEELKALQTIPKTDYPDMDLLKALRADNQEIINEIKKSQSDDYETNFTPKSYQLKELKKQQSSLNLESPSKPLYPSVKDIEESSKQVSILESQAPTQKPIEKENIDISLDINDLIGSSNEKEENIIPFSEDIDMTKMLEIRNGDFINHIDSILNQIPTSVKEPVNVANTIDRLCEFKEVLSNSELSQKNKDIYFSKILERAKTFKNQFKQVDLASFASYDLVNNMSLINHVIKQNNDKLSISDLPISVDQAELRLQIVSETFERQAPELKSSATAPIVLSYMHNILEVMDDKFPDYQSEDLNKVKDLYKNLQAELLNQLAIKDFVQKPITLDDSDVNEIINRSLIKVTNSPIDNAFNVDKRGLAIESIKEKALLFRNRDSNIYKALTLSAEKLQKGLDRAVISQSIEDYFPEIRAIKSNDVYFISNKLDNLNQASLAMRSNVAIKSINKNPPSSQTEIEGLKTYLTDLKTAIAKHPDYPNLSSTMKDLNNGIGILASIGNGNSISKPAKPTTQADKPAKPATQADKPAKPAKPATQADKPAKPTPTQLTNKYMLIDLKEKAHRELTNPRPIKSLNRVKYFEMLKNTTEILENIDVQTADKVSEAKQNLNSLILDANKLDDFKKVLFSEDEAYLINSLIELSKQVKEPINNKIIDPDFLNKIELDWENVTSLANDFTSELIRNPFDPKYNEENIINMAMDVENKVLIARSKIIKAYDEGSILGEQTANSFGFENLDEINKFVKTSQEKRIEITNAVRDHVKELSLNQLNYKKNIYFVPNSPEDKERFEYFGLEKFSSHNRFENKTTSKLNDLIFFSYDMMYSAKGYLSDNLITGAVFEHNPIHFINEAEKFRAELEKTVNQYYEFDPNLEVSDSASYVKRAEEKIIELKTFKKDIEDHTAKILNDNRAKVFMDRKLLAELIPVLNPETPDIDRNELLPSKSEAPLIQEARKEIIEEAKKSLIDSLLSSIDINDLKQMAIPSNEPSFSLSPAKEKIMEDIYSLLNVYHPVGQDKALRYLYKQGGYTPDTLDKMINEFQSYGENKAQGKPQIFVEKLKQFDRSTTPKLGKVGGRSL